jgi:hypothetical protein
MMNSLQDLRKFFETMKVDVKDFTGFSMVADGSSWGIVGSQPVRDGTAMNEDQWKEYTRVLRARISNL